MRAISRPEVLTRYLAKELGARGIVVSTVAPGAMVTDFRGGMARDNPDLNKRVADMTALGRVGRCPPDRGNCDRTPRPRRNRCCGPGPTGPLSQSAIAVSSKVEFRPHS
jgi:NAD(P)-dependent dehydrogenase (short-subunit alcohol dehydrogenase family)